MTNPMRSQGLKVRGEPSQLMPDGGCRAHGYLCVISLRNLRVEGQLQGYKGPLSSLDHMGVQVRPPCATGPQSVPLPAPMALRVFPFLPVWMEFS